MKATCGGPEGGQTTELLALARWRFARSMSPRLQHRMVASSKSNSEIIAARRTPLLTTAPPTAHIMSWASIGRRTCP
jgi:hypothetical protein